MHIILNVQIMIVISNLIVLIEPIAIIQYLFKTCWREKQANKGNEKVMWMYMVQKAKNIHN